MITVALYVLCKIFLVQDDPVNIQSEITPDAVPSDHASFPATKCTPFLIILQNKSIELNSINMYYNETMFVVASCKEMWFVRSFVLHKVQI